MARPDFNRLKTLTLSSTTKSSYSEICWREFLVANFNFVNNCSYKVMEDEIVEITKSLQNWTNNRKNIDYFTTDSNGNRTIQNISAGEICLADLGLNYELEFAYVHPVLVIEEIGDKLFIVPCTSTSAIVSNAYHPKDNQNGDENYRKVYRTDGFDEDCALIIKNIMIIGKGRILDKKGVLNENIHEENSIFNQIKLAILNKYFRNFFNNYQTIIKENERFKDYIQQLEKEVEILTSQIEEYKKETKENIS